MKTFYTTLIVSIMLIVSGFFVPPLGIIDGSVLTAVGLLLMFAVLAQVPGILQAVRDGERIKLSKGDFSAEVNRENPERVTESEGTEKVLKGRHNPA